MRITRDMLAAVAARCRDELGMAVVGPPGVWRPGWAAGQAFARVVLYRAWGADTAHLALWTPNSPRTVALIRLAGETFRNVGTAEFRSPVPVVPAGGGFSVCPAGPGRWLVTAGKMARTLTTAALRNASAQCTWVQLPAGDHPGRVQFGPFTLTATEAEYTDLGVYLAALAGYRA